MAKARLYDIMGVTDDISAAAIWSRSRIRSSTGICIDFDPQADPIKLVRYLQSALEFYASRPGASADKTGLIAEVKVNNPPELEIVPLVLDQMPDIAFYLKNTPGTPGTSDYRPARLYITKSDTGTELVIDSLPVEIQVPSSLIGPLRETQEESSSPEGGPDVTRTDPFQPGVYDGLCVTLRDTGVSSIFVHIKVRMTEELDFIIEPAVPISIGPCRFSGLPCYGLHDINFVPSPHLHGNHSEDEQALEWTRHSLNPLDRLSPDAKFSGVLTVRTVDLDSRKPPLNELYKIFNDGKSIDNNIEFVLEDIALPFFNLANLPIPSHGLFGLRRKIEAGDDPIEAYNFSGAPIQIKLGDWKLLIEKLLIRTPARLTPFPPDQFAFLQMALLFGSNTDKAHAATLGVTDEWTIQAGWHSPSGYTLFTIVDATLKLWGLKVGWSLKRFISKDPHYSISEQFQFLGDLSLSTKGTGSGIFKIRSLSGKDLEIVLRDIGWNLGSWSFEGLLSFPEGIQFVFADVVRLIVEELGWVTENNGGRYFSFSGGISIFPNAGAADRSPSAGSAAIREEKGTGGGIRFHRLRFLTGGNPNAPSCLLDGVTLSLKIGRFAIVGFGNKSEFSDSGHKYKELGFGIQVEFDALTKHFKIGMQLFYGRVSGDTDNFTYWMFGFQFSPIPIGTFELVNIRMLLAGNMVPNLPPPEGFAQNMRIFRWYRENGNKSITLPTNRKLSAWMKKDDSFAAGLGAGLSLPVGSTIVLDTFLFFHKSPEDSGLMIAIEAYAFDSPKPAGYGAIEFDFDSDKWGFILGVALNAENMLGISLCGIEKIFSVTGNLYGSSKPCWVLAAGQLNDQSTWLSISFTDETFIDVSVLLALCLQLVEGPEGPRAFGLVISAKGGKPFGIGMVQFYTTFGIIAGVWGNESKVKGFIITIELGLRIKVFWIFNTGISVKAELDHLGPNPTYTRLGCEIIIDTPWWLPDVNFRFEKIWGEPKPELMQVISTPIISAGAINPGTRAQIDVAVTPIMGTTINDREVYSMDQLRYMEPSSISAEVLDGMVPIGIDSIIAINFKPSVDDNLTVGKNTPQGSGTQAATPPAQNDLSSKYELMEIGIRRRPRFGPEAGIWTALLAPADTRLETTADLPVGSDISAHFSSCISFEWDKDLTREEKTDPRRLLVNAMTPYTFISSNPEADEGLARNQPGWPCCTPADNEKACSKHLLSFDSIPLGVRVPIYQVFSNSVSTIHWIQSPYPVIGLSRVQPSSHAAKIDLRGEEDIILARIDFDIPTFRIEIFAHWSPIHTIGDLFIEAYSGLKLVHQDIFSLSQYTLANPISIELKEGMTSMLLRRVGSGTDWMEVTGWVEITRVCYITVSEQLENIARKEKCKSQRNQALSGSGKLAWLPNHDYEISLTTKVSLNHVKTKIQEAKIGQKVFFRTKGLIGLNAVKCIGDELEPYVESRYPRNLPFALYRSEPVALAFNEGFNILMPLDRAPSPDKPDEINQILEWVLVIDKVAGSGGSEKVSITSPDWIVSHRRIIGPVVVPPRNPKVIDATIMTTPIRQAVTLDPFSRRFESMLHSSNGCNLPGPSLHRSQVLIHNPVDPGIKTNDKQLWAANSTFRVNVRHKEGAFIERNPFEDSDYTAFDAANEVGNPIRSWNSKGGAMQVTRDNSTYVYLDNVRSYAVFGESNWNHVQIHSIVDLERGAAGVAVGVAGHSIIKRAITALIDKDLGLLKVIELRNGVVTELECKSLLMNSTAPYALELITYDDILRVQVGEIVIDVNRNDIREGRLALVSQGIGKFTSLSVEPIDAYRFEFYSSRFISFEDHIRSFEGKVAEISANMMGLVQAGNTVSSMYTETVSEISAAMTSGYDREKRQRLFDRWVSELAIPLRTNPDKLELSKLKSSNGIELLLLESPEPLTFSEDISLSLGKSGLTSNPIPSRYKNVPIHILSNGNETTALIIPLDSSDRKHVPLQNGFYRFEFKIDRIRFRCYSEDDISNYRTKVPVFVLI